MKRPSIQIHLPESHLLAGVMIALTALITNGILIPRLGYYYDDWYMLWSGAARGPDSMIPLFSVDRPFMGVIYDYAYRLFHASLLDWHFATLLERIAGALAFYWILNIVWPSLRRYSALAGMLFVVFPGFLAEPNAATKINHLLGFGAALFSIALSLQAVVAQRRALKTISILLSFLFMALYLWIYEYMVGLEVMRLALLFWLYWRGAQEKPATAARKVLLRYIPNILIGLTFVFWRVFIFHSIRPATDLKGLVIQYLTHPLDTAANILFHWIADFFSASVFAWFVQPYTLLAKVSLGEVLTSLLLALLVVALAVLYLRATRRPESAPEENVLPLALVLIGALIVLAAVFPVVALNRHIDLTDPYKAYALHPSAGAIIMVLGLVIMLKPRFRQAALVFLIGFSVTAQTMNVQDWAKFWSLEKNMWWQLSWRAPDLQDNTLVMALLPTGYTYQQDYEIWGPIDLIYRPGPDHYPLIQAEVLNPDTVFNIYEGVFSEPHVRDIYVPKYYNNLLLISQPTASSCIHVIDGSMPAYSTSERPIVEVAGARSSIDRVVPGVPSHTPPAAIFGKEPDHGWCYYFQQASLARQTGDWKKIGDLYQAVQSAGLKPADPSEYFVFVEGLVNLGQESEAGQIINSVFKGEGSANLRYSICTSLKAAPAYPASFGYKRDQIERMICQ